MLQLFNFNSHLERLVFTDLSRVGLDAFAEQLKERITGLSGDSELDELVNNMKMKLGIWNIRKVKGNARANGHT